MSSSKLAAMVGVCAGFAVATSAFGVAGREDVPESTYVAKAAEYPSVGVVSGLFTGTLIEPTWVLTCAHGAELLEMMVRDPSKRVFMIGGESYAIGAVHVPEGRVPLMGSQLDPDDPDRNAHDIALIHLTRAVEHVEPAQIHEAPVDVGTQFVVVGAGTWSGDPSVGVEPRSAMGLPRGTLRAGTNRVDAVDEHRRLLSAPFDNPATGRATELECGLGAGDSGGPLLVNGEIVGVVAAYETGDDNMFGTYDDVIEATRVSEYVEWVRSVIAGAPDTAPGPGAD